MPSRLHLSLWNASDSIGIRFVLSLYAPMHGQGETVRSILLLVCLFATIHSAMADEASLEQAVRYLKGAKASASRTIRSGMLEGDEWRAAVDKALHKTFRAP